MKKLTELQTALDQEKTNVIDDIKAQHPIVTHVNVYSHPNIMIESDSFSLDIYKSGTYLKEDIKVNCSSKQSNIPTEEEAVAKVRQMHLDLDLFNQALQYVQQLMKDT